MEKSVFTNKMLRTEVEVRDIISGLPDSLLIHILSFLPAKEAVATSLLSKRWRPLWPSLTTLDLDRCDFQRLKFFHQFVDKMLKFVDLKSVKKFVLRLDYDKPREYFRPWEIRDWIIAVINNKVEHLELHLRSLDSDYELASSIFSANNIKVLKLIGPTGVSRLWSGVTVGTLSHVNLPLLEILHLESVKFPDFRSLEMLLSSCPLLKDLVLEDFRGNFKCPLDLGVLNHLVTADVPQYLLPLKVFSNVTFLHLFMPLQHKLSPLGPDIPTFHNLTYLGFDYYSHDWETTVKYLQSCPKLEILVIYEFDWSERLEPTAEFPLCVSSNLKEFHLSNYRGKSGEFELARFIMKNAMVLRIISISKYSFSRATWKSQRLKKISLCPISSVNCRLLLK